MSHLTWRNPNARSMVPKRWMAATCPHPNNVCRSTTVTKRVSTQSTTWPDAHVQKHLTLSPRRPVSCKELPECENIDLTHPVVLDLTQPASGQYTTPSTHASLAGVSIRHCSHWNQHVRVACRWAYTLLVLLSKAGHSGYPKKSGRVIRVIETATRFLSWKSITWNFRYPIIRVRVLPDITEIDKTNHFERIEIPF
jgi:hypothetical protein